jgi:hypothetical protein
MAGETPPTGSPNSSRIAHKFIVKPAQPARKFHEKAGLISNCIIIIAEYEIFIGKYQVTLCTGLVSLRSPAFSPFGPALGRHWMGYHGLEIWEYVFAHECLASRDQERVK